MTIEATESSMEYIEARRVLLDALEALGPQRRAVVLAGAQAIYVRAGPGSLVADFTTDGDLAIDPSLLTDTPQLGQLMKTAGFKLANFQGSEEPGIWEAPARINGVDVMIPVDLIVPEGVAPPGGSRGARLGPHGKRAVRKTVGLEAALVDNDPMLINGLGPADPRRSTVQVAGVAALLVAKTHKLYERVQSSRTDRIHDKDASDVLRLIQTSSPRQVATTFTSLIAHATAGGPTRQAMTYFQTLFGVRNGAGIEMAVRALRLAMPEERVRALCLGYANELRRSMQAGTEAHGERP